MLLQLDKMTVRAKHCVVKQNIEHLSLKTKYLASGNVLDGELAEAGKDKDAALLHLEGADGLEGVKGHAGLLAREAGESNLKRYLRNSQTC